MIFERAVARDPLKRALRASLALLGLTSLHHAYGASAFATPWRWHVVPVAILAAAALIATGRLAHRGQGRHASIARAIFVLLDLLLPGLGIGVFEGVYNHALKNALFFGGASAQTMTALFPPPTYEWPHDWFFEGSGIAQGVLGLLVIWRWYRLVRTWYGGGLPRQAISTQTG